MASIGPGGQITNESPTNESPSDGLGPLSPVSAAAVLSARFDDIAGDDGVLTGTELTAIAHDPEQDQDLRMAALAIMQDPALQAKLDTEGSLSTGLSITKESADTLFGDLKNVRLAETIAPQQDALLTLEAKLKEGISFE